MDAGFAALLAADILLFVHALFVAFVIGALAAIWLGKWLEWSFARSPWFRGVHLLAIGIVVLQSWLGIVCPLTTWEMFFRAKAGEAVYAGTFISHWLETILYYQAPPWVFAVVYSVFGLAVVASWIWVRPRAFNSRRSRAAKE